MLASFWFDDGDGFDAPVVEGLLWGLAAVGALARAVHADPGRRATWWLVAAGLLLIVSDKAWDLYAVFHDFGTWFATTVDPELHLRGEHAKYRDGALGLLFVLALGVLCLVVRRDRPLGRGKLLSLVGLGLVLLLLTLRMAPPLQPYLIDRVTKGMELLAWLLVVTGLWLGDRRAPPRRLVDGFIAR